MSSGSTGSRGKTTSKSKGEKIERRTELQTPRAFILRLRKALFADDSSERDVLQLVLPFAKFAALDATVTFAANGKIGKTLRAELFALKQGNMEELLDIDGADGWDEWDQEQELREEAGRMLIARDSAGTLLGYAHFAFSMQGELYQKMAGHPCLWMYSLQVAPEVQRSGLGRHLVTMCELIANKTNMAFVMFPVTYGNVGAEQFVTTKLRGYEADDMAYCGLTPDEEDDEGVQVYAKCVNRGIMESKAAEAEVQAFAREIAAKLGVQDAVLDATVAAVVAEGVAPPASPAAAGGAASAKPADAASPTSVLADVAEAEE
jgi:GNAT superfamily N-acetyltransferase